MSASIAAVPSTPAPSDGSTLKSAASELPVPARLHSWCHSPLHWTLSSLVLATLFFYQPHWLRVAIWSRIRSTIDDERTFLVVWGVVVHSAIFIGGNLVMALLYYLHLPAFEQFKIGFAPWPWRQGPRQRAQYFSLIRRSIPVLLLNQYLIAPFLVWLSYPNGKGRGMNGDVGSVPEWYTSMWQIGVSMLAEDALFYWAHRTLHHPRLYGAVHKLHHEYKSSIGIASEFAHPIEFILSNTLPFSAGPLICGMHYWTLFMWTLWRIGETIDAHSGQTQSGLTITSNAVPAAPIASLLTLTQLCCGCFASTVPISSCSGYEFPWSPYRLLPFASSATSHEWHHSHNVGNFGSFFRWWDAAFGTDVAFRRWEEKQMKKEQEQQLLRAASDKNKAVQSSLAE